MNSVTYALLLIVLLAALPAVCAQSSSTLISSIGAKIEGLLQHLRKKGKNAGRGS